MSHRRRRRRRQQQLMLWPPFRPELSLAFHPLPAVVQVGEQASSNNKGASNLRAPTKPDRQTLVGSARPRLYLRADPAYKQAGVIRGLPSCCLPSSSGHSAAAKGRLVSKRTRTLCDISAGGSAQTRRRLCSIADCAPIVCRLLLGTLVLCFGRQRQSTFP